MNRSVFILLPLLLCLGAGLWMARYRSQASEKSSGAGSGDVRSPLALPSARAREPALVPATTLSRASEIARKEAILDDIFARHDDSDLRLDTEFSHLTQPEKRALEKKYRHLPVEKRNERGTVVFLVGRRLDSPADVAFLRKVLHEPRCLSLSDCRRADKGRVGDEDASLGLDVSLSYPQVVAVKSLERHLRNRSGRSPRVDEAASSALGEALRSPSPTVAAFARRANAQLRR